ncbi:unnamed protein product [Clonostachys rosea]|uniref:DUF7600 domain-containing protein n=1 Tax=Bionectria ochroleuca TaxID=29856 RepID=A0ABY6V1S0_BIOOC|nr:unnamed protein product [Clonostachys rosea]
MDALRYDHTSCILCGGHLEYNARKRCARQIRVCSSTPPKEYSQSHSTLYASSVDCTQATLSGVGYVRLDFVQVPIDPNVADENIQPLGLDGLDQREGFIEVQLHSLRRHEHTQTLRQHGPHFVRPLVPFLWGFAIHSFCWDMLNSNSPPDLQALFQACLSMPLSRWGALDWGHDYQGLIDPVPIVDPRGTKLGSRDLMGNWWENLTPSQIPAIQGLVEAENSASSIAQPILETARRMISTAGDCFSSWPTELLEIVLLDLSSKDVRALRRASPVFANVQLREAFWASRFTFEHEFGYVLEARTWKPQSWRSLYAGMSRVEQGRTSLSSRYRIWNLASILKEQVREAVHPACHGEPVMGLIEPQHSNEWLKTKWQTATRGLVDEPEHFEFGCRPLRTRVVQVPTPLRMSRVVVSFARVGDENYISGLEFVIHNETSIKIGYTGRREEHIEVDESLLPIRGWLLALGMSGIQGIAAVMKDSSLSSRVGKFEDLPQYSLRSGGSDILAMKGEFDAFRMVSLSIHTSNMENQTWSIDVSWRYSCPWMPEIPPDHYFLNGDGPSYADWYMGFWERTGVGKSRPIDTIYFGGSHGEYLPLLKEIIVYAFVGRTIQISGIEFKYTDSSRDRFFGWTTGSELEDEFIEEPEDEIEDPEEVKFSVPIDGPGGERIKFLDVWYTNYTHTKLHLKGLRIHTDLRTTEVDPIEAAKKRTTTRIIDEYRGVQSLMDWVPMTADGPEIVGFYAVLGWNMIEHLGLISMNKP